MIAIVHVFTCVCMIQYICMGELVSFPLPSTSKSSNPLATDAGVCILSVDSTGSILRRGSSQNNFIYSVGRGRVPDRTLPLFALLSKCTYLKLQRFFINFVLIVFFALKKFET